ncbi:MAG: GNAT family N-acetyltransferase [Armatimonadetes bacterium]|nr:GNAT family N-acetyltransferase [Armatimonadota bacterium]
MELECRELQPAEAAQACAFTETIFGPLPFEWWEKEPRFTASVAFVEGEMVGCIPLSLRRLKLAPGVVVDTAWENAVGTREDLRSRGIGSAMIGAAREFLADRCDLLCVYRGAERSTGYHFYADKTGHVDLCHLSFHRLETPEGTVPAGFESYPHTAVAKHAAELARLHDSNWSAYGGFPERDEAYYPWIIDSIIWGRIRTERRLHLLRERGAVVGFCITGVREPGRYRDESCYVLDFAVAGGDEQAATRLLGGVLALAAEQGRPVCWPTGMHTPYLALLDSHGFVQGPRRMEVMAIPIRPASLFGHLAAVRGGCDLTLDVWTPTVDCRLWDAGDHAPRVTLEMKDRELCLMLTSRLDGAAALEDERITTHGPAPRDKVRETLARVLRCTPWAYHHLEYI